MSIEEKRREAFEAWFVSIASPELLFAPDGSQVKLFDRCQDGYRICLVDACWKSWGAALDSVEIDLPTPEESYGSMGEGMGDPWLSYDMDAVKAAIEACGLKVKV